MPFLLSYSDGGLLSFACLTALWGGICRKAFLNGIKGYMEKLEGKAALITGGTRGIGLGIAEALVAQGVHVTLTSRHAEEARQVAARLSAAGPGKAVGVEADVRHYDAQLRSVRLALDTFGQLDVVVANAGIGRFGPIESLSLDDWQQVIDVNLTGVFYTVKASVEALIRSKGYLITIASLAGTNFFAGGAAYNASKFGLVGFTQAVMLDLRHKGVRVTTLLPGSVATHFHGHAPGPTDSWKIQPQDIGQMVVDILRLPARTLPSKIEVRPSMPPKK